MKKKAKKPRWPDYEYIDLGETITFGTSLFMRKDKRALRILFPAGQAITFAPEDEIEAEKNSNFKEIKLVENKTHLVVE